MYSFATATAWILFEGLGTVRLTVCLSSSESMDGMLNGVSAGRGRAGIEDDVVRQRGEVGCCTE